MAGERIISQCEKLFFIKKLEIWKDGKMNKSQKLKQKNVLEKFM